jgi:hypothetical protein
MRMHPMELSQEMGANGRAAGVEILHEQWDVD